MSNSGEEREGLAIHSIDEDNIACIDPDNVFWAICKNNGNPKRVIPQPVASLYNRIKQRLDAEMKDFRFSANLSAIYIDSTDRCNADCPYCYVPRKIRKNGTQMDTRQLFYILGKILEYFKRQKTKMPVIIFHASEPLLVKEIIFEAIEKFKRRFVFGIQTNALVMEQKDVSFLKRNRVGVGISLDASQAALNNRTRFAQDAGGNFYQAIRAIEWFNGYAGLNVIATVTKINVKDLPNLVRFLHSKKVPCVLLNPVRFTRNKSMSLKPDENLFARYFIKAVDEALRLTQESSRQIIIGNFTNIILAIVAPSARRMMCDISPCGGGRCFLTITASGEMIPCGEFIGLNGFSGGNIFKQGIQEAMDSEPFKKIRARIVENISECSDCVFRNICGAPCPAELEALGGMHQKAVFCEFYKRIIEYAFKLIAEGKEKYCLRKEGLGNLEYEYKI